MKGWITRGTIRAEIIEIEGKIPGTQAPVCPARQAGGTAWCSGPDRCPQRKAARTPLMGVVRQNGEVVFFGKAMATRKRPDTNRLKRFLAAGEQQIACVVFAVVDTGFAFQKETIWLDIAENTG